LSVDDKATSSSTDIDKEQTMASQDVSADLLPKSSLESQMKEVEKLLNEGTLIQKTSKGLPELLQGAAGTNLVPSSVNANNKKRGGSFSVATATAKDVGEETKRPKRSSSANHLLNMSTSSTADSADAEGAQALVGLLQHVNSTPSSTDPTNIQTRRHSE